jgi:hypothetical protein
MYKFDTKFTRTGLNLHGLFVRLIVKRENESIYGIFDVASANIAFKS